MMKFLKKVKEFLFGKARVAEVPNLTKEESLKILTEVFDRQLKEVSDRVIAGVEKVQPYQRKTTPTGRSVAPYNPPPHALPRRVNNTKPAPGKHPGWRSDKTNPYQSSFNIGQESRQRNLGNSDSTDPANAAMMGYMLATMPEVKAESCSSSRSSSSDHDYSSNHSSSSSSYESSSYDSGSSYSSSGCD